MAGIEKRRQKPDSISRSLGEDRSALEQQIAWLHSLAKRDSIALVPCHDGGWLSSPSWIAGFYATTLNLVCPSTELSQRVAISATLKISIAPDARLSGRAGLPTLHHLLGDLNSSPSARPDGATELICPVGGESGVFDGRIRWD
jgi:hypothetical protein